MTTTTNDLAVRVAQYKYFAVDIQSNTILTELPCTDVSFERALKGAGAFSANITVTTETNSLLLYENTMPGKVAIYVVRDGICVWGGILWGREYNLVNRSLALSASEFTSYLHHRHIWKTFNYELEGTGVKTLATDKLKITLSSRKIQLPATDDKGSRTKVMILFSEEGLVNESGYYDIVTSPASPTDTIFYVDAPGLTARPEKFEGLTIKVRTDTYDYIRELITEAFADFTDVKFANDLIEPGVKSRYVVTYRKIESGIATVTTSSAHGLVPGQRVEINNVHADFNGKKVVRTVPSSTTFTFYTTAGDLAINATPVEAIEHPLKYRSIKDISSKAVVKVQCSSNVVTLTTSTKHAFKIGDSIVVKLRKAQEDYNNDGDLVEVTGVPNSKKVEYELTANNTTNIDTTGTVNFFTPDKVMEIDSYNAHNFAVNQVVSVYNVDDPSWGQPLYNGHHKVTAIESGATSTWFQFGPSYVRTKEPGSIINITKRQYTFKNAAGSLVNKVTLTTSGSHDFSAGDYIWVGSKGDGEETVFNGSNIIDSVPNDTTIVYKPSPVGTATIKTQSASGKVTRTKANINGVSTQEKTITKVQRVAGADGGTARITTSTAHNFVEGDLVLVEAVTDESFNNNGVPVKVTDVLTSTKFAYTNAGVVKAETTDTGFATATFSGFGAVRYPETANAISGSKVRTLTCTSHGFNVGDYIRVDLSWKSTIFNNNGVPVKIATVPNANTFTYSVSANATANYNRTNLTSTSRIFRAPYAQATPMVYSSTYGEFPSNTNLGGITFSDTGYSNKQYNNAILRGGEMVNIGDHLDQYSNSTEGFDYRIDCSIGLSGGKNVFTRQFKLIPRTPASLTDYLDANPLGDGEYAPASAFGADKLTFEYPGNISDIQLMENAENSATRMFVVGDTQGGGTAGSNASARYSAASATDFLADGWPILELVEKQKWPLVGYNVINTDNFGNYDVEADLYKSAKRFLAESRPPMGEYSVTVNGSLDPVVGTYNPGDWCQIVVKDDFISQRLNTNLEPRNDRILRKIESINVSVPNSPAFPEQITLNLIPEWEVDKRG